MAHKGQLMTTLRHHLTPTIALALIGRYKLMFHGKEIDMNSDRYKVFKYKGLQCCSCDNVGSHFRIERHGKKGRFHLNLYTDEGELMTKDHIKPKSKGGLNVLANYQTMCETCNKHKSAKFTGYRKKK